MATSPIVSAKDAPEILLSPDGAWRARIQHPKREDPEWQSTLWLEKATGAGEVVQKIMTGAEDLVDLKWSPDSRFLVMISSADPRGENPRDHDAWVFSMADRILRDLDGYFPNGFVADSTIGFEGNDAVVLSIGLYPTLDRPAGEVLQMRVDLGEASRFLLPLRDNDGLATPKASPDKKLVAVAARTSDSESLKDDDGGSLRLTILDQKGNSKEFRRSIVLPSSLEMEQMCWSPDSNFLVLTTYSSSGESHTDEITYVYCPSDDSLRKLSNYRQGANITRADIGFVNSNTVLLGVYRNSGDGGPSYTSYHTLAINLERDYLTMPMEVSASDSHGLPPVLTLASPDRKWFAATRAIPDRETPWKPEADRSLLVVREGSEPGRVELLCFDSGLQRIASMRWSWDNRYLVAASRNSPPAKKDLGWKFWIWGAQDRTLRSLPGSIIDGRSENGFFYFPEGNLLELDLTGREGGSQREGFQLDSIWEKLPIEEAAKPRK